jgi:Protein of unknown function (DUF2510)
VRRADAPRAGWYPDPNSRTSLRWWDGLDWTDVRRAPPSGAETLAAEAEALFRAKANDFAPVASRAATAVQQADSERIINEVRTATRAEINRATDAFGQRARAATADLVPLISGYTNRLLHWVRVAAIVLTVLVVAYVVLQLVAQASVFEWIGDRIDGLTDDENGAIVATHRFLRVH